MILSSTHLNHCLFQSLIFALQLMKTRKQGGNWKYTIQSTVRFDNRALLKGRKAVVIIVKLMNWPDNAIVCTIFDGSNAIYIYILYNMTISNACYTRLALSQEISPLTNCRNVALVPSGIASPVPIVVPTTAPTTWERDSN